MALFLSILFVLLAVNAILLIFSVNGAGKRFKGPIKKLSEGSNNKILPRESSETKYKEAVWPTSLKGRVTVFNLKDRYRAVCCLDFRTQGFLVPVATAFRLWVKLWPKFYIVPRQVYRLPLGSTPKTAVKFIVHTREGDPLFLISKPNGWFSPEIPGHLFHTSPTLPNRSAPSLHPFLGKQIIYFRYYVFYLLFIILLLLYIIFKVDSYMIYSFLNEFIWFIKTYL